jgi:hypothetical protein
MYETLVSAYVSIWFDINTKYTKLSRVMALFIDPLVFVWQDQILLCEWQ